MAVTLHREPEREQGATSVRPLGTAGRRGRARERENQHYYFHYYLACPMRPGTPCCAWRGPSYLCLSPLHEQSSSSSIRAQYTHKPVYGRELVVTLLIVGPSVGRALEPFLPCPLLASPATLPRLPPLCSTASVSARNDRGNSIDVFDATPRSPILYINIFHPKDGMRRRTAHEKKRRCGSALAAQP